MQRIINIIKSDIFLLSLISFVVFAAWSWLVPFDGGPDEIHHYEVVRFIATHGRWPTFGPTGDLYMRSAPGTRDGMIFGFYALQPTYSYLIPALFLRTFWLDYRYNYHIARIGSVIYGVITTIVMYKIGRLLFPNKPISNVVIPAFFIVIPQSAYIFSYINQDSFGIMATSLLFFSLLRLHNSRKSSRWIRRLEVGVAWGLTFMARQHVWVFGTIMVVLLSLPYIRKTKDIVQLMGLSIIPSSILACWFLRNYKIYNDLLLYQTARSAWEAWLKAVAPHLLRPSFASQGYSVESFVLNTDWAVETFKSSWAKFGYMNTEPREIFYLIFGGIFLVALSGSLLYIILKQDKVIGTYLSLMLILVVLHAYKNYTGDFQPQGRYLMIGYPVFIPVLSMGIWYIEKLIGIKNYLIALVILLLTIIHVEILWFVVPRIPGIFPIAG